MRIQPSEYGDQQEIMDEFLAQVREEEEGNLDRTGATAQFRHHEIVWARARIRSTGLVEQIAAWREADKEAAIRYGEPKHAGGRPRSKRLTDEHILIALLLLAKEHSPLWTTSVRNFFWFRLTPQAITHLGLDELATSGTERAQQYTWNTRADRALHELIDTMDHLPARRQIMNRAERDHWQELRKNNRLNWNLEEKARRKDEFSFRMVQMSVKMMGPGLLTNWKGSLSIDQTVIKAATSRGFAKGESKNPKIDSRVLGIDAGWAVKDPGRRGTDGSDHAGEATFGWKANFATMVAEDPNLPSPHPRLIAAMSLSKPTREVGEEAVRLLERLQGAGYPAGRVTTDKEYAAWMTPDRYYFPVTALGYDIVTDYHKNMLGKMGEQRGAFIVDGAYVCPAMPEKLIKANHNFVNGIEAERHEEEGAVIEPEDEDFQSALRAHDKLLAEAKKYHLRMKQAADENGSVKMMCPAAGLAPTVRCPLKPKSLKGPVKDKPTITKPPARPTDVCNQEVVTMSLIKDSRWLQKLQYKSKEWRRVYAVDRNIVEASNGHSKDEGKEALGASGRRRLRGLAAQQVLITFLVVVANMRKVRSFKLSLEDAPAEVATRRPSRSRGRYSAREYEPRIPEVREQFGLPPLERTPKFRLAAIGDAAKKKKKNIAAAPRQETAA